MPLCETFSVCILMNSRWTPLYVYWTMKPSHPLLVFGLPFAFATRRTGAGEMTPCTRHYRRSFWAWKYPVEVIIQYIAVVCSLGLCECPVYLLPPFFAHLASRRHRFWRRQISCESCMLCRDTPPSQPLRRPPTPSCPVRGIDLL